MVRVSAAIALIAASATAVGQTPADPGADDVVVTAQRTGIPVWRVTSPTTTLVLIGSIDGVAKSTRWDPAALSETLRKADRIMFPDAVGIRGSAFSLVGYALKWRKQATLPKGQTLADLLPPAQFQRLVALRGRGVLKPGFERKHPFHLALQLQGATAAKVGSAPAASSVVRRTARTHKLKTVPITSYRAKQVVGDFFAIPPRAYLTCLMDSVRLAEAGPAAIQARSDAWAQRRVPAVLGSPAEPYHQSCSAAVSTALPRRDLHGQVRALLDQPALTVAVLDLDSLAGRDGLLDSLQAAGFDVRGPRWKS